MRQKEISLCRSDRRSKLTMFKNADPLLFITVLLCAFLSPSASAGDWTEPGKVEEVKSGEREEALVTWWGFDEEDSTEYLQAAIESGARVVRIPNTGQPWIARPRHLRPQDNQTILFGEGVEVRAKQDTIHSRADHLFHIEGRKNVTLRGEERAATLSMPFLPFEDRAGDHGGHLIFVDGSENVLIEGVTVRDSFRDGLYVGNFFADGPSRNVTIRNVVADRNARQGLSITNVEGILVEDSVFMNNRGTHPMSGIDVETHSPRERVTDVVIRNNVFIGNQRRGINVFISGPPDPEAEVSILVEDNYVKGGRDICLAGPNGGEATVGIHLGKLDEETPGGEIVFRNNVVRDTTSGILVRRWSANPDVSLQFIGNRLYDASIGESWLPDAPVVLHGRGYSRQGNIQFTDTRVTQSEELTDRPVLKVTGGDDFEGWYNVSGVIRVDAPGEVRVEIEGTTDSFDLNIERESP